MNIHKQSDQMCRTETRPSEFEVNSVRLVSIKSIYSTGNLTSKLNRIQSITFGLGLSLQFNFIQYSSQLIVECKLSKDTRTITKQNQR